MKIVSLLALVVAAALVACVRADCDRGTVHVVPDCKVLLGLHANKPVSRVKIAWSLASPTHDVDVSIVTSASLGDSDCVHELLGSCFTLGSASMATSPNGVSVRPRDTAFEADLSSLAVDNALTEREQFVLLKTTDENGRTVYGLGDAVVSAARKAVVDDDEPRRLARREVEQTATFVTEVSATGIITTEYLPSITVFVPADDISKLESSSSSSGGFPLWALAIIIPIPILLCCCLLCLLLLIILAVVFALGGDDDGGKSSHRVSNTGGLQADEDDGTSYRSGRGGAKAGDTKDATNIEYPDMDARLSLTHQDNVAAVTDAKNPRRKHIVAAAESSSMRDWREMN